MNSSDVPPELSSPHRGAGVSRHDHVTHLLLIPDGHRRFAQDQGISYTEAYRMGGERAVDLVAHILRRQHVMQLSLYLLASKNFEERQSANLDAILAGIETCVDSLISYACANGVRMEHFGRTDRLTPQLASLLKGLPSDQHANQPEQGNKSVNLLIDYSGLLQLAALVEGHAWTSRDFVEATEFPPVDMVIRTGRCFRLSDAPILGTRHATMLLIPKYFPTVSRTDIDDALDQYEADAELRRAIDRDEERKMRKQQNGSHSHDRRP